MDRTDQASKIGSLSGCGKLSVALARRIIYFRTLQYISGFGQCGAYFS